MTFDIPNLNLTPRSRDDIVYGEFWGLTKEEFEKYMQWCHEIGTGGYSGAIGGDTTFHITPTSVGEIITATCRKLARDEQGNLIRKRPGKDGKVRYKIKTYKITLRDI